MSHSPQVKPKQVRDPPPSLFLGPPSQNASHVSLPGVAPAQPQNPNAINAFRAPLLRQASKLSQHMVPRLDDSPDAAAGSSLPRTALPRQQRDSEGRRQADRTDAQWAQMQKTLEEVELSAASGTYVFGAEHARALEGLRTAQIELARSWARSEAEDMTEDKDSKDTAAGGRGPGGEAKSGPESTGSAGPSGSTQGQRPTSSAGPTSLEDEFDEDTEADLRRAQKRREANDKYFKKVNDDVQDVVARLEDVAAAMKSVEQESRDIWGESESSRTSYHES